MHDEAVVLSNGRTVSRSGGGDVSADLSAVQDLSIGGLFAEALMPDAAAGVGVCVQVPLASGEAFRGRLAGVGQLTNQADLVILTPRGGKGLAEICGDVLLPAVHDPEDALTRASRALRDTTLAVRTITTYKDYGLTTFEVVCTTSVSTTVAMAVDDFALLRRALVAPDARPATPGDVMHHLENGQWDTLVGMAECAWFEAKRSAYGLADPRQKLELALDVSSLANNPTGGVLLIGCTTTPDEFGQDVVSRVGGLASGPNSELQVPRMSDVIEANVFPRIEGLAVRAFANQNRALICVYVPGQGEGSGPFIVKGHLDESGGYRGVGFSWVERQDSSKRAMSIAEVQARLAGERLHPHRTQTPSDP